MSNLCRLWRIDPQSTQMYRFAAPATNLMPLLKAFAGCVVGVMPVLIALPVLQLIKAVLMLVNPPQGSRGHYCVNSSVIRTGNIDGGCEELLKEQMGCSYHKNSNRTCHSDVGVSQQVGSEPPWCAQPASARHVG